MTVLVTLIMIVCIKTGFNVFRHIQLARRSIDLCVFSITCADLVEVVIRLNKMGVAVRVITDNEQVDATGSQIGRFRMEG
jgi:cardiolipin hydrolase